ncbi:ADP-ribosylglycohydrolase family protein [Verrucomicrobiaceae bacterium 227]
MTPSLLSRIEGLLLGTAVADSIGLPTEGMSPAKIKHLGWTSPLKHRFIFGRGMWSDDTEQTIMLSQALLSCDGDVKKFTRSLAWELRWWILGMPAATGLATARAIVKLWLSFPPSRSGVFSAGNGSAMRTAPIAAMFPDDPERRRIFTEAQTRITHSDPKAFIGTLAITELTALLLKSDSPPSQDRVMETLVEVSSDKEWVSILEEIKTIAHQNGSIADLLEQIGGNPKKGISGYLYQTVPAVILAGLRNEWDFKPTITELIEAGGDTDTTAAIAGALCGAFEGPQSIPSPWISGIKEWPTKVSRLSSLANALHQRTPHHIRPRWSPLLVIRNMTFLIIVLIHAFGRLLPRFKSRATIQGTVNQPPQGRP